MRIQKMPANMSGIVKLGQYFSLLIVLFLAACSAVESGVESRPLDIAVEPAQPTASTSPGQSVPLQPTSLLQPSALPTVVPSSMPQPVDARIPATTPVQCVTEFQRRELQEPYQRDKYTQAARYTLSTEELNAYLSLMGVEALCVPTALGEPFINADWNSATLPPVDGRMISLGFDALYHGEGWSDGFLVYSTYDFGAPTEYDTFATSEDWKAVNQGSGPDLIEVNGVKGLIRFKRGLCYGTCSAYKTFIFPFESYYVAAVYDLGAFDYDENWESLFQDFQAGKYPPERQAGVAMMDYFMSTIHFQGEPQV